VLYGPGISRWSMTERGRAALSVTDQQITIGPSAITWNGSSLTIVLDEVCVPLPRRIRGTITVTPDAMTGEEFVLNPAGDHRWWPIAPRSRVSVKMHEPELSWSGTGYLDHNRGAEPVTAGFRAWSWARAATSNGAMVLYDGIRSGVSGGKDEPFSLGLRVDGQGVISRFEAPPMQPMPTTGWRIRREARSDAGHSPQVLKTLEDTPFYARSLVKARIDGEAITAVHESLSVDRFAKPIVQMMLPFRMPRRG
jgi:carotenoid 1,2-hydratase